MFLVLKKEPFLNPWIFTGQRALAGAIIRDCSPDRLVESRVGAKPYKILPSSEHAGHRALHAVGFAHQSSETVLCILGQAALANGAFFSACNLLQLQPANVIFIIIEQELSTEAPIVRQSEYPLQSLASTFGIAYHEINKGLEKPNLETVLTQIWADENHKELQSHIIHIHL